MPKVNPQQTHHLTQVKMLKRGLFKRNLQNQKSPSNLRQTTSTTKTMRKPPLTIPLSTTLRTNPRAIRQTTTSSSQTPNSQINYANIILQKSRNPPSKKRAKNPKTKTNSQTSSPTPLEPDLNEDIDLRPQALKSTPPQSNDPNLQPHQLTDLLPHQRADPPRNQRVNQRVNPPLQQPADPQPLQPHLTQRQHKPILTNSPTQQILYRTHPVAQLPNRNLANNLSNNMPVQHIQPPYLSPTSLISPSSPTYNRTFISHNIQGGSHRKIRQFIRVMKTENAVVGCVQETWEKLTDSLQMLRATNEFLLFSNPSKSNFRGTGTAIIIKKEWCLSVTHIKIFKEGYSQTIIISTTDNSLWVIVNLYVPPH